MRRRVAVDEETPEVAEEIMNTEAEETVATEDTVTTEEVAEEVAAEEVAEDKEENAEEDGGSDLEDATAEQEQAESSAVSNISEDVENGENVGIFDNSIEDELDNITIDEPEKEEKEEEETARDDREIVEKQLANSQKPDIDTDLLNKRGIVKASRKQKNKLYEGSQVIPIHDELQYDSVGKERKEEYLRLVESQMGKKILYGEVKRTTVVDKHLCAVVQYGKHFRVLIPYEWFIAERTQDKEYIKEHPEQAESYRRLLMNRRIGSEVDFVISRIDEKSLVCAGNRLKAMSRLMQAFYFHNAPHSRKPIIEVGTKMEGRVVESSMNSMIVEVRGREYRLFTNDISSQFIGDVSEEYPIGSTVPVVFTKVERKKLGEKRYSLAASVSVKEAVDDPVARRKMFASFNHGDMVVSYVTYISEYGINVRLEGKNGLVDCLCRFPGASDNVNYIMKHRDDLPAEGSSVLVRITSIDRENLRIYGELVRKVNS